MKSLDDSRARILRAIQNLQADETSPEDKDSLRRQANQWHEVTCNLRNTVEVVARVLTLLMSEGESAHHVTPVGFRPMAGLSQSGSAQDSPKCRANMLPADEVHTSKRKKVGFHVIHTSASHKQIPTLHRGPV